MSAPGEPSPPGSPPAPLESSPLDRLCVLKPILEDFPIGVVIVDARGRFVVFNAEARRILAMGARDVPAVEWARIYGCYLPDKTTPFPPGRMPLVRALRGEEVSAELMFVRNDGQPKGAWIRISSSPLPSLDGDGGWAVAVFADVTSERKAVEDVELLSRAVEQTADSVIITDFSGIITYVNPAFEGTTGYTCEEAIGQTPRILKSGQHDRDFYVDLWGKLVRGEPFRGTLQNRKKNGELYWAEQTITPILGQGGEITNFVSVLKDITESRRRQEQQIQLRLARDVQQRFYKRTLAVPGLDVGSVVYPAEQTGGDYVDFVTVPSRAAVAAAWEGGPTARRDSRGRRPTQGRVDETRSTAAGAMAAGGAVGREVLRVAVGDVGGHGFDAALVMALLRAYVRSCCRQGLEVGELLGSVSQMLLCDLEDSRYATLLLAEIDLGRQVLSYSSAGHVPGFVLDPSGNLGPMLESTGLPLGMFEDCAFGTASLPLEPGQVIVLLTDGVTEAGQPDDFGVERVVSYVREHRSQSCQEIADGLYAEVRAFTGGEPPQDDVSLVVLKVEGDGSQAGVGQ